MWRINPAKYHIPSGGQGIVRRERLNRRLDQGLAHSLTLISAPAGYGKSTLVASWLRERGMVDAGAAPDAARADLQPRVAWYSLDTYDDVPEVFLTYLVYAIRTVKPAFGAQTLAFLQYEQQSFVQAAQSFLDEWATLGDPIVVVLEDYHSLSAPAIHELVQSLVRYASPSLRLFILSRFDPAFKLPKLRAQGLVTEIRAHDLRFTEKEVFEYLSANSAQVATEEIARALAQRTEGWITGLQLSAIAMRQSEDAATFVQRLERHADHYVIDYLIDEVLNELPLSVRSFLVMTSLLAQFNVRLAAHVTGLGEQECAQIVDYLRRANLFLISLDNLAYWYRYHHQFGDMLRHRLTLQCTAAEIEVLSSRAAAWLEDESLLDEALAQLAAGRQWPDACELIERHGYALLDRQAWPRLERWLSLLPAAWVQRRPVLLLFMAWICVPMVKPLERRRLLTGQAEALLGAEIAVEQRLFLQAQVFGLRSLYDSGVPLAQRAAAAEQALKGLGQRCGWITASVTYHRALQYCEQGELDAAVQLITSAIESWPPSSVTGYGILHYALLSLYYWQGTLADVESKARQLFQWFDAEQLPTQHAIACYYLAAVCAERGEFGEAKRLLLDILNPRRVALIGTRARALFLLFRIALFGGQDEITAHALDPFLPQDGRGQEGFSQGGDQPVLMQAGSACAALLTGDCAAALQWARAEVGEVKIGELARAQLPVLRAEILLAADRGSEGTAQALAILSPHTAYVRSIHLVGDTTQCAVLLALALWRSGSSLEALDALEEAVTLGFPRGYRWSFYRYGAEVADMLSALLQAGRSTHLVRGLLDAFPANCLPHATPEAAHAAARRQPLRPLLDHGVEPLTNREQEVLQLLARRLSNKQIAQMLCVSPATVRNHTANIYQKLAVPSRQVAVQRAQQLGLL